MSTELEDILDTIRDQFGENRIGKKHGTPFKAVPKENRKETIAHLVNTLKQKGKDKEYFKQNSVLNTIAMAYFPDALTEFWDKKKRLGAYGVVWRELREVLASIWPTELKLSEISEPAQEQKLESYPEYDPAKHSKTKVEPSESTPGPEPKPNTSEDEDMAILLGFKNE